MQTELCSALARDTHGGAKAYTHSPLSPATVMIWVLLILIYRYGEWHHRRSRLQGFLAFYRHTQTLRRMPVLTLSAGARHEWEGVTRQNDVTSMTPRMSGPEPLFPDFCFYLFQKEMRRSSSSLRLCIRARTAIFGARQCL